MPDLTALHLLLTTVLTESAPATVSITVENQAPTANAQSVTVTGNTPKLITLTGTDPNNDPLTFSIATNPTHGTLSGFNPATGEVTYTPAANYAGPDSFTFTVNDGTTESAPATVSITVENQAPTANAQSVTVTGNTPKLITLTGTDPNNDPLTFSIATNPTHGTLSGFNPATGEVTYTPAANYTGPDSFTFTVNDGTYRECSCDCLYNCREPGSDCQRTECNCYWKYSQADYTDRY